MKKATQLGYQDTIKRKDMKVNELLDSKLSLYRRVNDNESLVAIKLDDWLHKVSVKASDTIKELREVNKTDPKSAKAMKVMNLPCVTISGVFNGKRRASDVTEQNPIICIDIDEKSDDISWDELKKKVFELPYVFYVSLSARGEGIYALVYYNINNPINKVFKSLQKDFKNMGIVIDKNCKDICRLRFASYDENALEKTGDIEMYDGVWTDIDDTFDRFDEDMNYQDIKEKKSLPAKMDDSFTYDVIYYVISHCNYRADTYEDWLMDGFRLATFGEYYGKILFMYLSQMSEGYNELAAERKWRECVNKTQMTKECLYHYYRIAKENLGDDWRNKIR